METNEKRSFPVLELIYVEPLGCPVPLLDIPMMSDERERELGTEAIQTQ